ncbi:MAG TPA: cation diffusion facilitator family transporter [Bacteroidales bacterium]|nr:cation diffusion facilitator family transporter [Bacteroidales bacterium]
MWKVRKKEANKVTLIGFIVNLILTGVKILAGIIGQSSAMIADAVHSLSDLSTDLVVLGTLRVSSKPKDGNHKYGHGKVETLARAFIGIVLIVVGLGVLVGAILAIYRHFTYEPIQSPGLVAFYAAIASIIVKEGLYRYTIYVGKKVNSKVVIANAWHHRSDGFSSIGTVIGIGGAIFLGQQLTILDPIAAIVVSFFIFRVAISITWESLSELIETSLPKQYEREIFDLAASVDGVYFPHDIKTRWVGNDIAVDMHICVYPQLNIEQAHRITSEVEQCICKKYGEDTHVSIHTEPLNNLENT